MTRMQLSRINSRLDLVLFPSLGISNDVREEDVKTKTRHSERCPVGCAPFFFPSFLQDFQGFRVLQQVFFNCIRPCYLYT